MAALAGLALAVAGCLAGCLIGGRACEDDGDCGGETCARNGECAAEVMSVLLSWTVSGRVADEESCARYDHLSLTFEDADIDQKLTYEPIPCPLGRIYYDRMPARFDMAVLSAEGSGGQVLNQRRIRLRGPAVDERVDLGALAAPVD
ncbi:hypothetical protein [Haliangium sp.]|uniref:hypothetical protein n=1 Tax=Haliangium sp. TaxID=2663208 RepID=UPI003D127D4A